MTEDRLNCEKGEVWVWDTGVLAGLLIPTALSPREAGVEADRGTPTDDPMTGDFDRLRMINSKWNCKIS